MVIKKFSRYYKGTWIPCKKVRVPKMVRPISTSLYDDIIRLPEIIQKVKEIQESVLVMLKNVGLLFVEMEGVQNIVEVQ